MIWKVYKSSWLATFVSIVGAACIYGGIICLISGQILPAVICVVIGIPFYLLAEKIAANAVFKDWKKQVVSKGYAQMIAEGNTSVASQLYQQNPGEKTLKYFETLNPGVAATLRGGTQTGATQKSAPAAKRKPASGNKASGASNRTSRCAACGAALSPGSQFCAACGRKVQQARSCPMCGNRLADGAKFCSSCGYQL